MMRLECDASSLSLDVAVLTKQRMKEAKRAGMKMVNSFHTRKPYSVSKSKFESKFHFHIRFRVVDDLPHVIDMLFSIHLHSSLCGIFVLIQRINKITLRVFV